MTARTPHRPLVVIAIILSLQLVARQARSQIVNTLRGFDEREEGWSGLVQGVVAGADGNTKYFEFEIGATVQYQRAKHRWRLLASNMRRSAGGVEVAEQRLAHLRHNFQINSWLATVAFAQGQYDPFRRIDVRLLLGGGLRFDVIRGEKWNTGVGATYMLDRERLTDETDLETRHRGSFFLNVYRDVDDGAELDVVAFYQPVINDFSDARAYAVGRVKVDIVGGLFFLASYNLTHNSRPPAGVEKTDQSVRSGLGYEF